MTEWLRDNLHLTTDEAEVLVGALALLVALVIFVGPVRRGIHRFQRASGMISGRTRARYGRWFLREYAKLHNVYLNRTEELDLASTYVPLSFLSATSAHENRVQAVEALSDSENRRIIILGDPGTGKSTLLKAYGSGILRKRRTRRQLSAGRIRGVPILVPLRHFARQADGRPDDLARYIVRIFDEQAKLRGAGQGLLRQLLRQGRCIVLLDGLDEVPENHYLVVRDAILEFASGKNHELPTFQARIVLTCRRQNFLRFREGWTPVFAEQVHMLAPFNDSEIYKFVKKRSKSFVGRRSPSDFMAAVEASDTLDMHRVPLVLAISVGLYLNLDHYTIPRSVSKFYDEMILELLRRHDFRLDRVGSANLYDAEDKFRFLRQFALHAAQRADGFSDFTFAEIVDYARRLASHMAYLAPADAQAFVREIIDRSGLLVRTSGADEDEDSYAFAHRSIQEFLIALQLQRRLPAGADELIGRAPDPEWRQVIIFFSSLDHEYVNEFLVKLARANVELAGHCLAGALPSDEVATQIVEQVAAGARSSANSDIAMYVSALVSAIRAPRKPVSELAAHNLILLLDSGDEVRSFVTDLWSDTEGLLRLIGLISRSRDRAVVQPVPALAAAVPLPEPRLVGSLWRCLDIPQIDETDACRPVVQLLLTLATDPVCAKELEDQPAYAPAFANAAGRRAAYPFVDGWPQSANLVTLLVWADHVGTILDPPNRFFEAKLAGPPFYQVERVHRWSKSFRPYVVGRVIAIASYVAALGWCAWMLIGDWRSITRPFGWLTLLLLVPPGILAFLLAGGLAEISYRRHRSHHERMRSSSSRWQDHIRRSSLTFADDSANPLFEIGDFPVGVDYRRGRFYWDKDTIWSSMTCSIATLPFAVGLLPIAQYGVAAYLVGATLGIWMAYYLPATDLLGAHTFNWVWRRNAYVDLYEDPRSDHWVDPQRRVRSIERSNH